MPTCPACKTNITTTSSTQGDQHIDCPNCDERLTLDQNGNIKGWTRCSGCMIKNPLTGGYISCHSIPGYHKKPKINWDAMPNGERIYSIEELGGRCLRN
jgi:hypothetical protein